MKDLKGSGQFGPDPFLEKRISSQSKEDIENGIKQKIR